MSRLLRSPWMLAQHSGHETLRHALKELVEGKLKYMAPSEEVMHCLPSRLVFDKQAFEFGGHCSLDILLGIHQSYPLRDDQHVGPVLVVLLVVLLQRSNSEPLELSRGQGVLPVAYHCG